MATNHSGMKRYILDDASQPIECEDLRAWSAWLEGSDDKRRGAIDYLAADAFGGGPPVLWETMIFGGPFDQDQERYPSLEEARRGHAIMVARAKTGMDLL